jgi:hypothetical protein
VALMALSISGFAHSALSPFYHSVKEVNDLLDSAELVQILGVGREVVLIKRENKKIIIKTRDCQLDVKSRIKNINTPEAPKFQFSFGNLICF